MLTTLMWGDSSGFRTNAPATEKDEQGRRGKRSIQGRKRKCTQAVGREGGPSPPKGPQEASKGRLSVGSAAMGAAVCVFCDAIEGKTEVVVVSQTEHTLAFLDRSPVFFGHT